MELKKHIKFFELAKKLSKKSNHPRYSLGCVLVNRNTIIGTGWNMKKTHPKSPHPYHYIHAEFMAILTAGQDPTLLKGATCYVYRELRDGSLAKAKPCPTCLAMLQSYGIEKIFYTNTNNYEGEYIPSVSLSPFSLN